MPKAVVGLRHVQAPIGSCGARRRPTWHQRTTPLPEMVSARRLTVLRRDESSAARPAPGGVKHRDGGLGPERRGPRQRQRGRQAVRQALRGRARQRGLTVNGHPAILFALPWDFFGAVPTIARARVRVYIVLAGTTNLRTLGHTVCARPMFPLDENVEFRPAPVLYARGAAQDFRA